MDLMSASAGLVAALAVLAGAGPRGRPARRLGSGPRTTAGGAPGAPRGHGTWPFRSGSDPAGTLAETITGVASALRTGSSPARAWLTVAGAVVGPDGVPSPADLVPPPPHPRRPLAAGARARREAHVRRAAGVVAAGRLAADLGTPLAPVLDRVARTLATDEELDGERAAALAGPRSTATLLGWLPVLGVLLGAALGADPVGAVLRGGIGALSAVVGVALLVAGRVWTRRLVAAAQSPGDP